MDSRYHDQNFFMAALSAYKANILAALGVSALLLAVDWITLLFSNKFVEYVFPLILVAIFAYAIHYTILLDSNPGWKTLGFTKKTTPFFWRSLIFFGIMLLIVAVIFALGFVILGTGYGAEVLKGWLILSFLLVGMPFFEMSFAMIGTMLPATVAGTDASLAAAWGRSKGSFWDTF